MLGKLFRTLDVVVGRKGMLRAGVSDARDRIRRFRGSHASIISYNTDVFYGARLTPIPTAKNTFGKN